MKDVVKAVERLRATFDQARELMRKVEADLIDLEGEIEAAEAD